MRVRIAGGLKGKLDLPEHWHEWMVGWMGSGGGGGQGRSQWMAARGCSRLPLLPNCCCHGSMLGKDSIPHFFPILKPHQAWGGVEHICNGENSHTIPQFYHNSTSDISLWDSKAGSVTFWFHVHCFPIFTKFTIFTWFSIFTWFISIFRRAQFLNDFITFTSFIISS